MSDIVNFQKDLKNGASLEEALINNNVSLKDAFDYAMKEHKRYSIEKSRKERYKRLCRHIYQYDKVFYIRRTVKGKVMIFGSYYTVSDAKKIRDCLDEYGWEQKRVDEYCKMCGVTRHKSKYQKVRYS